MSSCSPSYSYNPASQPVSNIPFDNPKPRVQPDPQWYHNSRTGHESQMRLMDDDRPSWQSHKPLQFQNWSQPATNQPQMVVDFRDTPWATAGTGTIEGQPVENLMLTNFEELPSSTSPLSSIPMIPQVQSSSWSQPQPENHGANQLSQRLSTSLSQPPNSMSQRDSDPPNQISNSSNRLAQFLVSFSLEELREFAATYMPNAQILRNLGRSELTKLLLSHNSDSVRLLCTATVS
eukprot:GHVN01080910.1.p1 GENE.GHVN01080910.1~~GHVN01080910.1.p1  ORF type:complete len:234 (+),score=10.11 GHVN01080910.1:735-1436(+)